MKISQILKGLLAIQEKYGDIDVTVERKDMEFQKVNNVYTVHYGDSKENFVVMTDNKLFKDTGKEKE